MQLLFPFSLESSRIEHQGPRKPRCFLHLFTCCWLLFVCSCCFFWGGVPVLHQNSQKAKLVSAWMTTLTTQGLDHDALMYQKSSKTFFVPVDWTCLQHLGSSLVTRVAKRPPWTNVRFYIFIYIYIYTISTNLITILVEMTCAARAVMRNAHFELMRESLQHCKNPH